jgi:tetratricopeptide (TPR) repeat protein
VTSHPTSHPPKQKKRSALPFILSLGALAALVGGGVYYWKNHGHTLSQSLDSFFASAAEEGQKKGKKTKKKGGRDQGKPDPASRTGEIDKPSSTAETSDPDRAGSGEIADHTLERLYDEALACYERLEYGTACRLLSDLLGGPGPAGLKSRARDLLARNRAFADILLGIEPWKLSNHRDIVIVHLVGGGRQRGRIRRKTTEKIYIEADQGIKAAFRKDEIDRIEKVSPEVDRKAKEKLFDGFEKKARQKAGDDVVLYFLLAEFCIEQGLPEMVNRLLEKGLSKDKLFPQLVYNEKARRVYAYYLFFKSRKLEKMAQRRFEELEKSFPKSFWLKKANKDQKGPEPRPAPKPDLFGENPRPEPDPRPEPKPGPRPDPQPKPRPDPRPEPRPKPQPKRGSSDILDSVQKWIRQARSHEEKSMPGRPNAEAELKKAIYAYQKAVEMLEKAEKAHPERGDWIELRFEEVLSALYWCRKRQKL